MYYIFFELKTNKKDKNVKAVLQELYFPYPYNT